MYIQNKFCISTGQFSIQSLRARHELGLLDSLRAAPRDLAEQIYTIKALFVLMQYQLSLAANQYHIFQKEIYTPISYEQNFLQNWTSLEMHRVHDILAFVKRTSFYEELGAAKYLYRLTK